MEYAGGITRRLREHEYDPELMRLYVVGGSSCSRMYNDYDGIQHDYTRKQGLVWQQVFLLDMAPAEWTDREVLWNAVEEAEKTKDSRLAREFIAALPVELDWEEWITLLTDFI